MHPALKRVFIVVFPWLALLVAGGLLWHRWGYGRVVASAHLRADGNFLRSDLKCVIRKYPKSMIPFARDGYYYGCEVRWHQVLLAASAFSWDNSAADVCSVRIASREEAVFTIGEHRIRWSGNGWQGSTWDSPQ